MAAKKPTAQQQKEKREKIILAVLVGVLVVIGAIQAPKLMGGSKGASSAPPTSTTATASGSASLTAAPAAAPAGGSQLTRLGSFSAKDPFKAQVQLPTAGTSSPAGTTAAAVSKSPAAKKGASPVTLAVTPAPKTLLPQVPQVPAALLLVNGKKLVVPLNGTFPKKSPLFQLVSISPKQIELKLIGGSLSGGDTTFKLLKGHPLRLVNQTAGTKFVLAMVKPTTAPKPAPTTTTTPATTTAASTTTSTTPAILPPATTTGG